MPNAHKSTKSGKSKLLPSASTSRKSLGVAKLTDSARKIVHASPKPGRPKLTGHGDRLSKRQIAFRTKISPTTVQKYLEMDGAPPPDGAGFYSLSAFLAFFELNSDRSVDSAETRRLKDRLLELRVEVAEREAAVARGLYIARTEIAPVISSFFAKHLADAQFIFEQELPAKYSGKNQIECQQLNADGIDRLFTKARAWQHSIVPAQAA